MMRISLKWRMLILVLALTIISQVVFLVLNVNTFRQAYEVENRLTLQTVGDNLKENLLDILNKGIPINKLVGLDKLLKEILGDAPNIAFIALSDSSGLWLYYCDRESFLQEKGELQAKQRLLSDTETAMFSLTDKQRIFQGRLLLSMDLKQAARAVRAISLDTATIGLIAVLATLDLLFFFIAYTLLLPIKRAEIDMAKACAPGLPGVTIRRSGIPFIDLQLDHFDRRRLDFQKKWLALKDAAQVLSTAFPEKSMTARDQQAVSSATARLGEILNRFHFNPALFPPATGEALPVLIRPAVFLFVFAESLTISFLPLFAKDIYHPIAFLSEKVVLGLPISAFMLFTALSMPLGGAWSDKIGRNRAFMIGAFIAAAGLFLCGTAGNISLLIAYRAVAGLGFGIVFITAQGYIIDTTTAAGRAEGMAIFLSAFYGGTLCGSGIGGMLADRIGFRALFYAGSVIALASAFFIYRFTPDTGRSVPANFESNPPTARHLSYKTLITLLTDRQFAALTLLQSIPNKICLIGFVYYLSPLWLKAIGNSQSDTGRYIMGYSLCMILFSQTLSKWSDRFPHPKPFIVIGGILSGLALIPCYFRPDTSSVALGIILLGMAHALSVSNQAKLASQLDIMEKVGLGPGLGIYRQIERVGNVLAPICLGLLVSRWGYAPSLAALGVFTMLSSLLFGFVYATHQESRK